MLACRKTSIRNHHFKARKLELVMFRKGTAELAKDDSLSWVEINLVGVYMSSPCSCVKLCWRMNRGARAPKEPFPTTMLSCWVKRMVNCCALEPFQNPRIHCLVLPLAGQSDKHGPVTSPRKLQMIPPHQTGLPFWSQEIQEIHRISLYTCPADRA